MSSICMDVDAALAEVPVNIAPLIDDTDFKTIEDSVAYNATGMALNWNFVTTAGAYTQTAVTPTTGGDYDWASQGAGMYSIEIPASGGASINNDTEGFGWFSGVATGVLPWVGPVICFKPQIINTVTINSPTFTTKLNLSVGTIVPGTVDTGSFAPTTTQFEADDITEATADHYNGRVIIFTSGALQNQATTISDYVLSGSNGKFTVVALTEAPANNDTFIIV